MTIKRPLIFLENRFLGKSIPSLAVLAVFFLWNPSEAQAQLNIGADVYIDSGAELHIAVAETRFSGGKITTARGANYGLVSFAPNANWSQGSDASHVDGFVRASANSPFVYPIGNDGVLQPAVIEATQGNEGTDLSFTFQQHPNLNAELGIAQVSDQFYWELNGSNTAYITLSWNDFSSIDRLTNNEITRLSIAGFDGTQWRAIDSELESQGLTSVGTSFSGGTIRSNSPVNLNDFSALTLVRTGSNTSGMPIGASEGFTPDGDGINDTWYVEDIQNYPNAHIIVYSRWNRKVFEVKNGYNNDWNGVFENSNDPLPTGSYAYVIDLEGDGEMDLSGWVYISR